MADFNALRDKLRDELGDNHQRAALAKLALDQAEEAIGQLASLGYRYDLIPLANEKPVEYPKMLYRDGPQGLVTATAQDAKSEADLVKAGFRLTQKAIEQAKPTVLVKPDDSKPTDQKAN